MVSFDDGPDPLIGEDGYDGEEGYAGRTGDNDRELSSTDQVQDKGGQESDRTVRIHWDFTSKSPHTPDPGYPSMDTAATNGSRYSLTSLSPPGNDEVLEGPSKKGS
jgi:hypothetical protein